MGHDFIIYFNKRIIDRYKGGFYPAHDFTRGHYSVFKHFEPPESSIWIYCLAKEKSLEIPGNGE